MKKIIKFLVSAVCAAVTAVSFSACAGGETSPEKVSLLGIDKTAVGVLPDVEYYVAAEPDATARATAVGLKFSGDLQQLYGEDGGYPQAVIVAKNELVESNPAFLSAFLEEVEANEDWLKTASAQTIIDAVAAHLPEDKTPTFNAKNLTSQVISNCGIHLVYAADDKERVTSFLDEMAEVEPSMVGEVSESFFCTSLGTASTSSTVSVYAPDGAPALALAKLMSEENTFSQTALTYNIVEAEKIVALVSGENPVADICILPVNAASKLLGSGQKYKMLGTVTNGNLYILSKDGEHLTAENLSVLKGKTVGVINLANVPGLTLKIVLNKYDIPYETVS